MRHPYGTAAAGGSCNKARVKTAYFLSVSFTHFPGALFKLGERETVLARFVGQNTIGDFCTQKEAPGPATQQGCDQGKVEHICEAGRKSRVIHSRSANTTVHIAPSKLASMRSRGQLIAGQGRTGDVSAAQPQAVRRFEKRIQGSAPRPGIEPVVLLGVLIFQFLERVPDRQAAELVKYHLGWKLALNLKVSYQGFHHTVLTKFRERLERCEKRDLAMRTIMEGLQKEGLVSKRSKQRLDSTHILGAVARLSSLECVRETLALALETEPRVSAPNASTERYRRDH